MNDIDKFIRNINWTALILVIPAVILLIHVMIPFADIGVETANLNWIFLSTRNTTPFATAFTNINVVLMFLAKIFITASLAFVILFAVITNDNAELIQEHCNNWLNRKAEQYKKEAKDDGEL